MRVLLIVIAVVAVTVSARRSVLLGESTVEERLERAELHWNRPDFPHVHQGIAWMAEQLLSSSALEESRKLLGGPLADSAAWADTLRTVAPVRPWAADLHFIDVPPYACNYDPTKDCHNPAGDKGVCVDGAIQNYTARLTNLQLDSNERIEALKFLIHLIGDIHGPLHAGNEIDLGGNKMKGTFMGGPVTTLHAIWDGDLPRVRVQTDFNGNATAWFERLVRNIRVGHYRREASKWVQCARPAQYGHCSDQWGRESSKLACLFAYVLPDGVTRITDGFALDRTYYDRNIAVVERQVAKAAVRLANVLSLIWPDVIVSSDKVKWVRDVNRNVLVNVRPVKPKSP